MKFVPKTEKEIRESNLLPKGEYPFQISGAVDHVSAAGNPSIKLTVRVYKPDGNFYLVDDYLSERVLFKIKHLCDIAGLSQKYESGEITPDDFIGVQGNLELSISVSKDPQWSDKNQVKDYIVPKSAEDKKPLPKKDVSGTVAEDLSDDIPF